MVKLGTLKYSQPGDEEGCIKLKLEFFRMPPIMQIDILMDWISDLHVLLDQITESKLKEKLKEKNT
jgi:hypothetical protein